MEQFAGINFAQSRYPFPNRGTDEAFAFVRSFHCLRFQLQRHLRASKEVTIAIYKRQIDLCSATLFLCLSEGRRKGSRNALIPSLKDNVFTRHYGMYGLR
jgi:hypothetical protein